MFSTGIFHHLLHWVVSGFAVFITSKLTPGFRVSGFGTAMWASALIGLANVVVWPILILFTLPINILTLGLFTFVVNGAVLKICAGLLKGFDISGWWSAIFGAIILSVTSALFRYFML